jgi:hypothetical protein
MTARYKSPYANPQAAEGFAAFQLGLPRSKDPYVLAVESIPGPP